MLCISICHVHVTYHILQVVTVNNKNRVLESCHSQGEKHLDKDKTLGEVSKQYYWPKMLEDVEEFCLSCEQCQKANRLYTCTAWYTNMHKNIDTVIIVRFQPCVQVDRCDILIMYHPLTLTLLLKPALLLVG